MRSLRVLAVLALVAPLGAVAPVPASSAAVIHPRGTAVSRTATAWSAPATTPGVPQAGTPIYTEDFSNQDATSAAISILDYTGSAGSTYKPGPDGTGANGETYTADTFYTPAAHQCDGWIMNSQTPAPSPEPGQQCSINLYGASSAWAQLQGGAINLGEYQGQSAAAAAANQALTEFTNGPPSGGPNPASTPTAEFKTSNSNIPATGGHYYAVSADYAETSCQAAHASLTFELLENGTPHILGTGLDPCTDASAKQYPNPAVPGSPWYVSHLQSGATQLPVAATPALGLELVNLNNATAGNDTEFDLPQIVDVTPQLDKSFSPASVPQGGTSALTYTITNTSELDAKNGWTFTDTLPSGLTVANHNASTTCPEGVVTAPSGAASVSVTGDLSQGMASCTVTVDVTSPTVGTYTNGPANVTEVGLNPPGSASVTFTPSVNLAVTKTASMTQYSPGKPLSYTITVTNSGPSAAAGVTVSDPLPGDLAASGFTWTCTATTGSSCAASGTGDITDTVNLAVVGTVTYTVTGTVPASETGSLTNTVTVTPPPGSTDTGCSPDCTATVTTPHAPAAPSLTVVKSASPSSVSAPGQVISYSFVVANTGNVTLHNVTVTDTQASPAGSLASGPACPSSTLAPGAAETCTATYPVTQADLDNGSVTDTATASGTPPSGPPVTSPPSSATIPVASSPSLTVVKSASPSSVSAPGQVISYSFVVANTGNVTLHNVTVTDTQASPAGSLASGPACPSSTLAPGAAETCTATYPVTQADIHRGNVTDTATASGTTPSGTSVASTPSQVTVPVILVPPPPPTSVAPTTPPPAPPGSVRPTTLPVTG